MTMQPFPTLTNSDPVTLMNAINQIARIRLADINDSANIKTVSAAAQGYVPPSPSNATNFLNGAASPAFANVKDSDLSVTDVTTNNLSTSAHGFTPKAPNDTTKFLRGDATWSGLGITASTPPVIGASRNLIGSLTTASQSITISADQIIVATALNGTPLSLPSFSQTLNIGATGAGGIDTGAAANTTFYSVYAIAKSDGTQSILACTTAGSSGSIYSNGHFPTGYTYSGLIGVLFTNGAAQFLPGLLLDREWFYQSGISILTNTGSTTLTSQSISAAVPTNAKTCSGTFQATPTSATIVQPQIAADGTGTGLQQSGARTTTTVTGMNQVTLNFRQVPIITSQTIYFATGGNAPSSDNLLVDSFTF